MLWSLGVYITENFKLKSTLQELTVDKNLPQNLIKIVWNVLTEIPILISLYCSNFTVLFEFHCNGFRGVIICQQVLTSDCFVLEDTLFSTLKDWGSCFSLVYYYWESYYFRGVNIHRYTAVRLLFVRFFTAVQLLFLRFLEPV